ncbi:MAG: hypothetical protein R3232_01955 [Clostridia bacterium]|nr:hypothetical protein [Clostridia bacterium]
MAKKNDKYIIAVKDYENTVKALSKDDKSMPRDASVYIDLFNNVVKSCSDMAGLKKFIKASKFAKKDCIHYWEGLMTLGYTLIITEYESDDENFVENSCENDRLKFISAVR